MDRAIASSRILLSDHASLRYYELTLTRLLQPAQEYRQPPVDAVDVEGGDFHPPVSARDPLGPDGNRPGHALEVVACRKTGDAPAGLQIVVAVLQPENVDGR